MKKSMRYLLALGCFYSFGLIAQDVVKFNPTYSYKMLNQTDNFRKHEILLEERKNGNLTDKSLYLSGQIIALADYHSSNTDSKFSYLMRHPGAGNQVGKDASEAVIHSAQVALTGLVSDWGSSYIEFLYNPEQSFGSGTIVTVTRNQVQMRRGFVTFGNLEKFPVYFSLGKMDAPFSDTSTVNPFTDSMTWHAFGGLAYGGTIGFKLDGFNFSYMFVQGGAQFRALNTDVEGTAVPSRVNNGVVDINYTHTRDENKTVTLGLSFENGSAYCQGYPITHFAKCEKDNPAWSVYTKTQFDKFLFKFALAQTVNVWPGTFNPDNADFAKFAASKVTAFDVGAKYDFYENDKWKLTGSFEFSKFIAGPTGAPWEFQRQAVFGISAMYNDCCKLFAEYLHIKGYAPLNFLSGNPDNGDLSPSDINVLNNVFILGALFSF